MSILERPLLPHLDIQSPDYASMGFVLGLSRLGEKLGEDTDHGAGAFVLGVNRLGDTLGEPPIPVSRWRTWIRHATDITIKRGFVRRGIGLRTDVGIMTFTLRGDQDPLNGGTFAPGQIVRVVQHTFLGPRPLFTGTISDVRGTYVLDKQTGEMVTGTIVTASDAVLTHTQTMRYGVRIPSGSETFEERIGRLEATSRVPVAVPPLDTPEGDYPQRLRSTVYESDLASHFDLACNSVGAVWFADTANVTQFARPIASQPVTAVFSDTAQDGALLYVDIDAGYDTAQLVNVLDITNHGIGVDGLADDDEFARSNPESVSMYGPRRENLDVNVSPAGPGLTARLADVLAAGDTPQRIIRSVVWNAQQNLRAAAALELGQRVLVERAGIAQDSRVIGLAHVITPTRWLITVRFSLT